MNRKPGCAPGTSMNRTPPEIEEKILYIRKRYHFGPQRISWYLERYHGIRITAGCVYYVLRRNNMHLLPRSRRRGEIPSFRRYEKQVPGHHVQVDVKFLSFIGNDGKKVRRYQYGDL